MKSRECSPCIRRSPLTDNLRNDYIKTLEGVLSIGQSVKIRILKVDVKTVQMVASIRHALEPPRKGTQAEQKKAAKKNKDAEAKARNELLDSQPFAEVTDLQPLLDSREAVRGIVKNIAQSGLFVSLSREVTARVQIKVGR